MRTRKPILAILTWGLLMAVMLLAGQNSRLGCCSQPDSSSGEIQGSGHPKQTSHKAISPRSSRKYDEAIAKATKLIDAMPDLPSGYVVRAEALCEKREYEKAIADITKAIELSKDNRSKSGGYYRRAAIWRRQRLFDRVLADYHKAIELDPKNYNAFCSRAMEYYFANKLDFALKDANSAIKLEPTRALAYGHRSQIFTHMGKHEEAKKDAGRALQLERDFLTLDALARALEESGDYKQAASYYAKSIADNPEDHLSYQALASLLAGCPDAEVRDGKRAITYAQKACELTQWKGPYSLKVLAAAYAEDGQFELAVKWQKKATDLIQNEAEKRACLLRIEQYRKGIPFRKGRPPVERPQ